MPKKLERCIKSVIKSGKPESNAWAICKSSMGMTKKSKKK